MCKNDKTAWMTPSKSIILQRKTPRTIGPFAQCPKKARAWIVLFVWNAWSSHLLSAAIHSHSYRKNQNLRNQHQKQRFYVSANRNMGREQIFTTNCDSNRASNFHFLKLKLPNQFLICKIYLFTLFSAQNWPSQEPILLSQITITESGCWIKYFRPTEPNLAQRWKLTAEYRDGNEHWANKWPARKLHSALGV